MASALANRLRIIRERGGIRSREIAELLDTTPETVSRWNSGRVEPQPDRLKRLLELEWLLDQLSSNYKPDEARLWLFSPHRMLGGKTPADKIRHGGIEEVLALVAQIVDGAYV